MKNDIQSLSTLRDIVVPEAPPLWPLAPGMWLIIAIGLMVALLLIFRLHGNRKRSAYRRAGILLLQDVQTLRDISVLLKRVALSVFPREEVAPLYGNKWAAFLTATCPRGDFSEIGKLDPKTSATPGLIDLAGLWIRYHQLSDDRAPEKRR
jgi:hypothetical protein